MNEAAEQITGYTASEIIGKAIDNLVLVKDSNGQVLPAKSYTQSESSPQQKHSSPIIFATLLGKEEHKTQVEISVAKISETLPDDLDSLIILHDVTQERVLKQMQIDFVSMASHEFRTPLTSIINYLAVLSEEIQDKLSTDHKGFLERALSSAKQLSFLVDNLLNVSKIERGSITLSLHPVNWAQHLTSTVQDHRPQTTVKNITLDLDLPPTPLPNVLADDIRINEVLNNLVGNAINYTPKGGHIKVGAKVINNQVVTYVADSGMGIPQEAIPHLFTKFFRVPGALEEDHKGTGLGLYISKSIIDLHHGKIWVESITGKGSTFYFTLPMAEIGSTQPSIAQLHS